MCVCIRVHVSVHAYVHWCMYTVFFFFFVLLLFFFTYFFFFFFVFFDFCYFFFFYVVAVEIFGGVPGASATGSFLL